MTSDEIERLLELNEKLLRNVKDLSESNAMIVTLSESYTAELKSKLAIAIDSLEKIVNGSHRQYGSTLDMLDFAVFCCEVSRDALLKIRGEKT